MRSIRVSWFSLKKGLTALGAIGLLSSVVAQGGTTGIVTPRPGNLPNGTSFPLGMTADGSKLLFMSYATNIAGSDPDGQTMDLFVYDVPSRAIRRLSDNTNQLVFSGSVSPSGRYVTFATSAANNYGAYLMDLETGAILREISSTRPIRCAVSDSRWIYQLEDQLWGVSLPEGRPSLITQGFGGSPANSPCELIYASEDGRVILFTSRATNLIEGYAGPYFLARLEEDAAGNWRYRFYPFPFSARDRLRQAVLSPSGRIVAVVVEEGEPERYSKLVAFDLVREVQIFASQPTRYPISIAAVDEPQVAFADVSGLQVYNWETNATWRPKNYKGRELRADGELARSYSGTCLRGSILIFFSGDDGNPMNEWVPGDRNRLGDVFLYNADTGKILGVSYNATGPVPNNPVGAPQLGNTNAPLAFISGSSNLVDNDTNNAADIFVWDGVNPVFRPLDLAGVQPLGNSESPNLSRNGRFLVFTARAPNLPGGSTSHSQVYFLDLRAPRVEHISRRHIPDDEPIIANGDCAMPDVSNDGRYIVFTSEASNLVQSGGRTDVPHVYLYDRSAPASQRLRMISNPESGGTSPVISSDGQWVFFVGSPGANESEILGYHIPTGNYLRRYPLHGALQGSITQLAVNRDGRFVALVTDVALVANDTNSKPDVYVWKTDTEQIELVSKDSFGRIGNDHSFYPSISDDGRYVAFASEATNWVSGVAGNTPQVYVYDRQRGWLYTIKGPDLRPADAPCDLPEISGDGRYVAFQTNANNLTWDGDITVSTIAVHEIGCVPPGDVNRDGIVDDADLLLVLFAFGSDDIRYDLNADSIIDDADLLIVLFNFGLTCTSWAGDLATGDDNGPDLSDLFSGTSVLPSDVVNRDPFDWKSYMRQVAELDMLHQGKWPYPVAGLGSDPWVQLYGDPVGGTWYYDPPARNEQGMFGDFFPASSTWSYSTGWKGFQIGNSNINVYGGGQVDLSATCQGGGSLSGTAKGELGFNVFGMNLKVAEAYFYAGATNSTASLNAYFKVVGQTVWSRNLSQNLAFVWPSGSTETNPVTIWSANKSWSKSWTFSLGIVPVKITVSANASLGVKCHIKGSLAPVEAVAVVQPYVNSSVSAQGGVSFSIGCSAGAGVGASLTLLNDTLTARGKARLGTSNNRCCVFYELSLYNQINALNGSVYAYAEACCWGLSGPSCGWRRKRQQWNWTLFTWPGLSNSGYWFNQSGQYCF